MSVEGKLKVCYLIRDGQSYSTISKRYGIGKLTIADISKSEAQLKTFARSMIEQNRTGAKNMKLGEFHKLAEALYVWFQQK